MGAKSSGLSSKKAVGRPRGRPPKSHYVKPTPEVGGMASPAESRESNDSDDVPLVIESLVHLRFPVFVQNLLLDLWLKRVYVAFIFI